MAADGGNELLDAFNAAGSQGSGAPTANPLLDAFNAVKQPPRPFGPENPPPGAIAVPVPPHESLGARFLGGLENFGSALGNEALAGGAKGAGALALAASNFLPRDHGGDALLGFADQKFNEAKADEEAAAQHSGIAGGAGRLLGGLGTFVAQGIGSPAATGANVLQNGGSLGQAEAALGTDAAVQELFLGLGGAKPGANTVAGKIGNAALGGAEKTRLGAAFGQAGRAALASAGEQEAQHLIAPTIAPEPSLTQTLADPSLAFVAALAALTHGKGGAAAKDAGKPGAATPDTTPPPGTPPPAGAAAASAIDPRLQATADALRNVAAKNGVDVDAELDKLLAGGDATPRVPDAESAPTPAQDAAPVVNTKMPEPVVPATAPASSPGDAFAATDHPLLNVTADGSVVAPEPVATESSTLHPITRLPIADLRLSKDVPQFKEGADANGVVEPLGGTFDDRGNGPIQVWRRNDGTLEVISGRHRFDLAKRSGTETIPAQVYDESAGFTAQQAAALDAELNIRDGQGSVADYVQYFRSNPEFAGDAGQAAAESAGLLARSKGRRAYAIASQGSTDLVAAHRVGAVTDDAAAQVAAAAPSNAGLQALGLKLLQDGKPINQTVGAMRAAASDLGERASQTDMFGFDDSQIKAYLKMGRIAAAHEREIGERLAAVTGAAKRPELAKREGVDVNDAAALQARIAQLRSERDAWARWATDPDKVAQVRQEAGLPPAEAPRAPEAEEPAPPAVDDVTGNMFSIDPRDTRTGDLLGGATNRDRLGALQRERDAARNGRSGGRVDTGDGGLFDGERPEQARISEAPGAREVPESDLSPEDQELVRQVRARAAAAKDNADLEATMQRESAERGEREAGTLGLRGAVTEALTPERMGNVHFVHDEDGLPAAVRRRGTPIARGNVRYGLHTREGDTYIFTGSASTPERAVWTAWHENGHEAVARIVAGHPDVRVGSMAARAAHQRAREMFLQNPVVKAIAEVIARQRRSNDLPRMAEEALVELHAAKETGNWQAIKDKYGVDVPPEMRARVGGAIDNFVRRLKDILNAVYARISGDNSKPFGNADVFDFLSAMHEVGKGERGAPRDDAAPYYSEEPASNRLTSERDANRVETSTRDLFTRTRGDVQREQEESARKRDRMGADAQVALRLPDAGKVANQAADAVEQLVRGHRGSVLADALARDFRHAQGAQLTGRTIRSHADLAALASVYRNASFETLHYIFVDANNRVIGESAVSSRLPASSAGFPAGYDETWLLDRLSQFRADGFWMLHNHPSGVPEPSGADIGFTNKIRTVFKREFRGHVVIDHDTFGMVGTSRDDTRVAKIAGVSGADPLRNAHGPAADVIGMYVVRPRSVAEVAVKLNQHTPANSVALIAVDSRGKVSLASSFPVDAPWLEPKFLREYGLHAGAARLFVAIPEHAYETARPALTRALEDGHITDAVITLDSGGSLGSPFARGATYDQAFGGSSPARQVYEGDTAFSEEPRDRAGALAHGSSGAGQDDARATRGDRIDPRDQEPTGSPRAPGESLKAYGARLLRDGRETMAQGLARNAGMRLLDSTGKQVKQIGRGMLRAYMARIQRTQNAAEQQFKAVMKVFDGFSRRENLEAIHQWETGQDVTSAPHRLFFAVMDKAFKERIEAIRKLDPTALQSLIENYFPHIWKDPTRAAQWYASQVARRPLNGDRSFLKQRVYATIKEGMDAGLEPISTNPVDLFLGKVTQMDKFIAFGKMRDELKGMGWLQEMRAGERPPLGYARVESPAFQKAMGLQGYFAVPETLAKDINNYLSPGLNGLPPFRALRWVQNTLTMAQLGWSGFHAGFTTFDNAVLHAEVGLRRALMGDFKGALTDWLHAPLSVVASPIEGGALNRGWVDVTSGALDGKLDSLAALFGADRHDVNTLAILDALEEGGARWKMSRSDYTNDLNQFLRAFRQRDVKGSVRHVLGAFGEAGSFYIHHMLVPNQKMAARVLLAKYELDRLARTFQKNGRTDIKPGAYKAIIDAMDPTALRQVMGTVVRDVDSRLGQMAYDNLFWNRGLIQIGQTMFRALGWQIGTVGTVTGGFRDIPKLWHPDALLAPLDKGGTITDANMGRVTGRLSYLFTLAVVSGMSNALLQYALTGQEPSEPKDFFFPRTGRKNSDGSDERLQLPSYWMDHWKIATHPLQTLGHKINPLFELLAEPMRNQNFWGAQIRDPHAKWSTQAAQLAKYWGSQFLPFTFSNGQKVAENGGKLGRQVANFFGVTDAPASVTRTDFQTFVGHNGNKGFGHEMRSQIDLEHSRAVHKAEAAVRSGEAPDMTGMTLRDRKRIARESRSEVPELEFRKMDIEDKLQGWDIATPKERQDYHLRRNILLTAQKAIHTDRFMRLPEDQRQAIYAKLREIRADTGGQ